MISVIVPAYEAAQSISACVQALRAQKTSEPYEVIVVDDGSTDLTAQLAEAAGARVLRAVHQGQSAARNLGMLSAHGDTFMFTDADCVAASDWIAQMSAPLADPAVDGVKGAYGTRQRGWVPRLAQLEFEERYDRLERTRFVDFFDTHALTLRKKVLQSLGNFDTLFYNNEDVDLAYRYATVGKGLTFNRSAVVYHSHPANWPVYMGQKFWRGYWRMQVYRRYPGKMLVDSYTPNNLKAQVVLVGLLLPSVALALMGIPAGWVAATMAALLGISAWPLARLAWRVDRPLVPWVPLFVLLRGLSIGLGVLLGILTIAHVLPLLQGGDRTKREPRPAKVT